MINSANRPAEAAETTVLFVLPLVLQHSQDLVDTQLLCTLLQVSQGCRTATQQSGAKVKVHLLTTTDAVVCSFASWLRQHAGLVSTLTSFNSNTRMLEQVVSLALECYAWRAAADTLTPIQPLQLAELRWRDLESVAILQALQQPGCLTQLDLLLGPQCVAASMLAAVRKLKGLRDLKIQNLGIKAPPQGLISAVRELSALTRLYVQSIAFCRDSFLQLPCSLQDVALFVEPAAGHPAGAAQVPLGHLTNVKDLTLHWDNGGGQAAQVELPPNLTKLCCSAVASTPPASLSCLDLFNPKPGLCLELLQGPHLLPYLRHVSLHFSRCDDAESALQMLQPVVAALSSLALLTYLEVQGSALPPSVCVELEWGQALGKLTALRELSLTDVDLADRDALHLCSLTNLTALRLVGGGISDLVVSALALKLTRLVRLNVGFCELASQASLPVLATLTGLRELELLGNLSMVVDDTGLMLLSSLTALSYLSIPEEHVVSEEVMQRFVDHLPGLARVACG